MDDEARRRSKETYDLGLGFFGFFAVAFVGVSLFLQVTGRDAVWASLSALAAGAVTLGVWIFRRRFLARPLEEDG